MTTANLLNVSSVSGKCAAQTEASKRLQEETREVAEVFASMMNQVADFTNPVVEEGSSDMGISKTDGAQSIANSYERYSYKDNQIGTAREQSVAEKLDEAQDAMEQVEEEIVNTLSEEYGVDEEAIRDLLEGMGLSVLDLLNPQNLASFVVELTGVASGEELLLDESFLKVLETLDDLAQGMMKELNVDSNGLYELIAQMDTVNEENEATISINEGLDVQMEQGNTQEVPVADEQAQNVDVVDKQVEQTETDAQVTQVAQNAEDATEVQEEITDELKVQVEKQENTSEEEVQTTDEVEEITTSKKTDAESSLTDNQNSEGESLLSRNSNSNEALVTGQTTLGGQVTQTQNTQFSSYLSVDTVQIMEQIVEQMRVNITPEKTSMEMQINPENLGKVFVNISAEEGVVNAQFTATNEVVKEALEAQIATLRENLNQAGVKVDAIEVTIASHEFERNLEQNQQNTEEEVNGQENSGQKRRNLTIDSLDELSGLMTEEETLVAQIMKDNGNSVDLTA